ncbi:STAS domain-containing protein [Rhodococcus sp. NPDC003318]|uniref:STAS domain-containing protein n=1 Tax=Rhodococcus sp. NPDC003318 TaxID=3364503 RepID=UPI00368F7BDC
MGSTLTPIAQTLLSVRPNSPALVRLRFGRRSSHGDIGIGGLQMRIHIHCLDSSLVGPVAFPGVSRGIGPGPTVASVTGDLDIAAIPQFEDGIDSAIDATGRTLVVDLTRVGFVSVSGVQALAAAQLRADHNGVAMLLVARRGTATRALHATGLTSRFQCFPSVRAAVDTRREELAAHIGLDYVIGQ